jgi:hypothetical protein
MNKYTIEFETSLDAHEFHVALQDSLHHLESLKWDAPQDDYSAYHDEYTCDNETCRKYYSGAYNDGLCGSCSDDDE